ncbi:rho GTPase-activating protein 2 [Phoenix dactylifera]|uniref:Rho GTPase-activating protein 2 n=1 Tax=Phoenix dactylifera TaxID=42345 RepID=A0A8B7D3Z4_PHODC|nr:rho GTPase-activating protein 2 [Phoenix dactylifera]
MTGVVVVSSGCRGEGGEGKRGKGEEERQNQISLLALLLAAIRRSMVACRMDRQAEDVMPVLEQMEIGWPTDVRHVAHVTFDRFNGFLGLPVEFEVEIPCRVPSASASVFGVSSESMQCSYDSRGNSVPTILLLMQERLYQQGGLKAEGIFRINPENGQEEHVREQLNKGIVPDDIDVHCLAGLIKAWFRELPEGVLDCLSPEQVLQCTTEEECVELLKLLLPTQAALLNWAVDLMADVVEEEESNKMNARNIAMVFAPNMTQMSDPLTALMHAVQVMNFLKTLILKTLREREEAAMEGGYSPFSSSHSLDQQDDDDDDDDDDLDSQPDTKMSGESKEITSDDDHDAYSRHEVEASGESGRGISVDSHSHHSSNISEDDEDFLKDIEECFLRQLEWKEENGYVAEDSISQGLSSGGQAKQPSCSDYNTGSCLSVSESKQGSSGTSCEADSETSVIRDVIAEAKNLWKQIDSKESVAEAKNVAKQIGGNQVEMVGCKWTP